MRKVFLDTLPKIGSTDRIDWSKSVKRPVEFVFDEIKGQLIIEKVESTKGIVWITYKNYQPQKIKIKSLKQGAIINVVKKRKFSKEELVESYLYLFKKLGGKAPTTSQIKKEHRDNYNFPSMENIYECFSSINELKQSCGLYKNSSNIYSKDELINILREVVDKKGLDNIKISTFRYENIPTWEFYCKMFETDDLCIILKECGYELTEQQKYNIRCKRNNYLDSISKEQAIEIIYNMQKDIGRPLKYDDFRNPSIGKVSITTIKKYWGTMNQMKKELNLIVNQEDMVSKHVTDFDVVLKEVKRVCDLVYRKENRKIISWDDIENLSNLGVKSSAINKCCVRNNTSIRKILDSYGYTLLQSGNGLNYIFEDGEKTKSSYEKKFSEYLRMKKFKYNETYFRDVRYKTFIDGYNGMLDCDYVIVYNNVYYYIEIAGVLRDYENNFYNNLPINSSKSKENYRKTLIQKRNMLYSHQLNYYILFPKDIENILEVKN